MKKYAFAAVIALLTAILFRRIGFIGNRNAADSVQSAFENSGIVGVSKRRVPLQRSRSDIHSNNVSIQAKGVRGESNSYTLVYSNITLTSVRVEGPMEKMIGTERFEMLAKKEYAESLEYEKKLKKIKDIIEAEKPDTDRLYSAVHLVYALRADVQDSRQRKFDMENSCAVRIGEIEGDSKLSESDKAGRIQSEVNQLSIWKLSFEMDARNREDRFLRQMASLVGELSEATLDRLNSFEPQFGPQRFEP